MSWNREGDLDPLAKRPEWLPGPRETNAAVAWAALSRWVLHAAAGARDDPECEPVAPGRHIGTSPFRDGPRPSLAVPCRLVLPAVLCYKCAAWPTCG